MTREELIDHIVEDYDMDFKSVDRAEIESMAPADLLESYLNTLGIYNYSNEIMDGIEGAFNIELDK